jgi:hypothetical protein
MFSSSLRKGQRNLLPYRLNNEQGILIDEVVIFCIRSKLEIHCSCFDIQFSGTPVFWLEGNSILAEGEGSGASEETLAPPDMYIFSIFRVSSCARTKMTSAIRNNIMTTLRSVKMRLIDISRLRAS